MKKAAIQILIYVVATVMACCLAALTSLPFLKAGDFSIQAQMIFIAFMSGFYILTFVPLVVVTHILLRNLRPHPSLPLWAIPTFGAFFPVLGFTFFSKRYWPEEPVDMNASHVVVFVLLALFSIGIGTLFTLINKRRLANQCASPNGGPGARYGNSEVRKGPPSVS